jgi:tyrosine-protein phosphatase SIW14
MTSLRQSLLNLGLLATLVGAPSQCLANSLASPAFETAPELTRVREVSVGIYRGSQPEEMADMVQLFGMGVRTVYTLVTDQDDIDREQEFARILGMRLVSVPMSPLLTPDDETVNFLLAEIQDPRNQPVYLHCRHGKDRTGLIFGLYRVEVQGWTPERAFAEMREIGFSRWLVALERYFWKRTRN